MRAAVQRFTPWPAGAADALGWIVVGSIWWMLLAQLHLEWSTNDDYGYGYVVPVLAIYLLMLRFRDAPAPVAPRLGAGWIIAFAGAALALLPFGLIREANPEWRLVSWGLAGSVVALTLLLLHARGGARWMAHLAFPVVFTLTAVPWLTVIEGPLVQGLMRVAASGAAFFLNWIGIPASRNGNLIEAGGALIGVSEACSGIRSMQITLMASLFLGELYRFSAARRLLLLVLVGAVALAANFARTFFLAWISVKQGAEAADRWHDTAGYAVLGVALASFWGMAAGLNRRRPPRAVPPGPAQRPPPGPWPTVPVMALGVWLLAAAALTAAWFGRNEQAPPPAAWDIRWPSDAVGFKELPIHERTRAILKYSDGRQASWTDPGSGKRWTGFFFRWDAGRTSAVLARTHRPEICLPAVGCTLVGTRPSRVIEVGGHRLSFSPYTFAYRGAPLYVWWCLWDGAETDPRAGHAADWTDSKAYRAILEATWRGERNRGQQVLELALAGASNEAEAEAALAELVPRLVLPARP